MRSRRVGIATFYRLMNDHAGDAAAALDALPGVAARAGVAGYAACPPELAEREFLAGERCGARPLFIGETDYPNALTDLADPPPMLWVRGRGALARRPAIALVGARNASSLGLRTARALAQGLGRAGHVIASGLARGIDAAAHSAALETGTIAVVAGGVDVVYPRENAELTRQIAEDGLILSEMPIGMRPQARHFPRRNRIVSGLSAAVVVVEAAARSGTLITAREALDLGRDVLAVPGHPFDSRASGCNMLIRDGATLVRGAEDVLEALAPFAAAENRSACPDATAAAAVPPPAVADDSMRARILSLLGAAPIAEDQLRRDLTLPGEAVSGLLLELELEGAIHRQPGGLLARPA
ncbi:DNA-protecting protein DprA [Tropicimonas sp. IMCC6043]|nr:DNA-protecting protein DprA [Tropicimonas sp. IMCC6043]